VRPFFIPRLIPASNVTCKYRVAAGEISQALEVLNLLLPSGSQTAATISTTLLTNSRPPPKPSVQSLNALMATGTKSTSLKSASDIFSEGAQRLGTEVVRSEDYWKSALKLRTGNWGLIAMPVDERERRGKDALARDFLISYGLEQCECATSSKALRAVLTFHASSTLSSSASLSNTNSRPNDFFTFILPSSSAPSPNPHHPRWSQILKSHSTHPP
jgi:hypothetical protein